MRQRLPLILAALALVVALFGATPLGDAAPNWVKRALYAKNANKVDGIHAAREPKPNRLLALDANGQFPESVLPPIGVESPVDPVAYSKWRTGPVDVPDVTGPIAQLDLPANDYYVIFAKAWFSNQGPPTAVTCDLTHGSERDRSRAVLETATAPLANAFAATLSFNVVVDPSGGNSPAVLDCADGSGGHVSAHDVKVTAISVLRVTNTPGLP